MMVVIELRGNGVPGVLSSMLLLLVGYLPSPVPFPFFSGLVSGAGCWVYVGGRGSGWVRLCSLHLPSLRVYEKWTLEKLCLISNESLGSYRECGGYE
jgi:hypothetical protein